MASVFARWVFRLCICYISLQHKKKRRVDILASASYSRASTLESYFTSVWFVCVRNSMRIVGIAGKEKEDTKNTKNLIFILQPAVIVAYFFRIADHKKIVFQVFHGGF